MARQPTKRTPSPKRKTTPRSKASKTGGARKSPRKSTRKKQSFGDQLLKSLSNGVFWGVFLVLLGLFTLLALLSTPGSITGWWLEQLSLVFGIGMYFMPLVAVISGLFLFLHSSGKRRLRWSRLLGLLAFWLVFQATVHLLANAAAPLEIGRSQPGDFGGWLGWVISQGLVTMAGMTGALAVLLLLALLAIFLMIGRNGSDFLDGAVNLGGVLAGFLASLPGRLRREPNGRRLNPSLWERFRGWLTQPRQPKSPGMSLNDLDDGRITTLDPDPVPPPPGDGSTDASPETVRIIGGPQITWRLPRVDNILEDFTAVDLTEEDLAERARVIEETLHSFGVPVTVVEVNKGPVVTQFGLKPEYVTRKVQGVEKRMKVRVSKIQALTNDLSLALAAAPIRIEAPVPGRNIVGLEVPNKNVSMVSLRGILESEEFGKLKGPLRIGLGQDVSGRAVAASLARMPHLLVAGATGSGKSVCVNAIICSLLFQYTPDQLRFVMVDPKRVELTGYNGIPHLIDSVVTDIEKVIGVLHWATTEMDRRYKDLERAGARNIEAYNSRRSAENKPQLPYIVIVIDELADIMMMAPEEVERSLVRLAQMARATGIHLVISTQRPSVNVVTGLIKANFPSRVSFAVTSQIDSRVILDTPGAERLLGRGDMLFMRPDSAKLARLQGAFLSDGEVNRLVRYWRGMGVLPPGDGLPLAHPDYSSDPDAPTIASAPTPTEAPVQRPLWDDMMAQAEQEANRDDLFAAAVAVVQESGRASTSLLQRRLRIGYSRAARLIDILEEEGIVGEDRGGTRGREVLLIEPDDDEPPFEI